MNSAEQEYNLETDKVMHCPNCRVAVTFAEGAQPKTIANVARCTHTLSTSPTPIQCIIVSGHNIEHMGELNGTTISWVES